MVQSTTLSSQTLDVVWVERIHLFEGLQKLAPGLYIIASVIKFCILII